ncbi:nSTAND1 domain-containing NTPase [Streptomyces lasiicapitis]|uniref:nSTAND1 domain-containing NTPase n=1 Tax=Streptomyces lasiicapitis TaxID=1923961 RepID=UPI0036990F5F
MTHAGGPAEDEPQPRLQATAADQARIYQAARDQNIAERDLHVHLEDGAHRLRQATAGGSDALCPYPGLAPFRSGQSRWFFGRAELTSQLLSRLDERRDRGGSLVVVAPSGAGKSSLLHAGLLAGIAQGRLPLAGSADWPRLSFTPTSTPLDTLTAELASVLGISAQSLSEAVRDGPMACTALARRALRTGADGTGAGEPAERRVIVVVDQFEELFALCKSASQQHTFLDMLSALSAPGPDGEAPVALTVYGLRSDFYTPCADFPQLRSALQEAQVLVGPLSRDGAREAIIFPARAAGLEIEPGLVEVLLQDLGNPLGADTAPLIGARLADRVGAHEAGRLPLLAHALRMTWQARHGHTLTVDGYRSTGGIPRALANTAEQLFAALDSDGQAAARVVFLRLVKIGDGVDDTRRRVAHTDLTEGVAHAATVIDTFTQGRLLAVEQNGVEITHEVLLRAWPRLHTWIEADRAGLLIRQDLEEDAAVWKRDGCDAGLLYRGVKLEQARAWRATADHEQVSPTACTFLSAAVQHQRRAARVRRTVIALLSVLTLIACTAAVVAFHQRSQARTERDTAVFQQLMAEADRLRLTQPSEAAQFDLAAYGHRVDGNDNADLTSRLVTDASNPQAIKLTGTSEPINAVAFSPNGKLLASACSDGTVRLWSLAPAPRTRQLEPLRTGRERVHEVSFSPDGRTLATGSEDGFVRLWDMDDPANPTLIGSPLRAYVHRTAQGPSVYTVAFSPSARTLVAAGLEGLWVWDITRPTDPRPLRRASPDAEPVDDAVFSPDGSTLATSEGLGGTLRLWETADQRPPKVVGKPFKQPYERPYDEHKNGTVSLAFSPNGKTLASADQDVRLWDVTTRTRPKLRPKNLVGHDDAVKQVAFSPDGTMLASVGGDAEVQLWNVTDIDAPAPHTPSLLGHNQHHTLWDVQFSEDGRQIASGSNNGDVLLWRLPGGLLPGRDGLVASLASHPTQDVVASATWDGQVRLWDTSTAAKTRQISAPLVDPRRGKDGNGSASPLKYGYVTFSRDGRLLAAGGSGTPRGGVRLWDTTDLRHPQPLGTITAYSNVSDVLSVSFSPDGKTLAVAEKERMALYDISRPGRPTPLGKPLIGPIDIWDEKHEDEVNALSFSPDGHLLAAVDPSFLRLWDVTNPARPQELKKVRAGKAGLTDLQFVPQGHTLVTADFDGSMRLWDVSHPTRPTLIGKPLTGHDDGVRAMAVAGDGRVLASASDDQKIRLWDLSSLNRPEPLGQALTGHTRTVTSLAINSSGRVLVSSGGEGTTRLWPMKADDAVRQLCQATGSTLTRAEWNRRLPALPYRDSCP